jgi:hypothetical protein
MVNATENDVSRSVWVCGPHQDDAIHHIVTPEELAALTRSHWGATAQMAATLGSHGGVRFALLGATNTGEKNAWNPHYSGPIFCITQRDTCLSLATLHSIIDAITTPINSHTVHIYPCDVHILPTTTNINLSVDNIGSVCTTHCAADATTVDSCTILTLIEPISNTPILVIGRTRGTDAEKNGWIKGMYGPVVVSGGTKNADDMCVFTDVSTLIIRSHMAWMLSQPQLV